MSGWASLVTALLLGLEKLKIVKRRKRTSETKKALEEERKRREESE